jgi:hypothetical protein
MITKHFAAAAAAATILRLQVMDNRIILSIDMYFSINS